MIDDFIKEHKHFECSYLEFSKEYVDENSLHNHTLENLFLYFSLSRFIEKNKAHFYLSLLFLDDKRRYKMFINVPEGFLLDEFFNFSSLSEEEKKKFSIYSNNKIESNHLIRSSFKETFYKINDIFSIDVYKERYGERWRKKFYNKAEYPFRFLLKEDLMFSSRDIEEGDLEEVRILHKEWCDFKLADPKTFKMMFSTNRYIRCLEESFQSDYLNKSNWYRKGFYINNKLIAVRQCLIKRDTSYDIGFFSRFWDIPSNMINYINTYCMKDLQDRGVIYHNCGNEMNKNLKKFKEHFPSYEKIGYKYNFKK